MSVPVCVLLVAGCGTVREARRAQREVAGVASGARTTAPAGRGAALAGKPLEDFVAFALTNRPSVASAVLEVADARLALRAVRANAPLASVTPWNALNASATLGHSESSTPAHFDDIKSKTDGSASGGLSLDVLLWDFGRNDAEVRAQAERVIAAEMELSRTCYTVFGEVAEAYFTRRQNDSLLEVALTNEQMRVEHLRQAEERLEAGEAQKLDVLRARLDVAEAREAVVAASNDFVTAGARLASALGLEASEAVAIGGGAGSLDRTVRAFADTSDPSGELFAFARTNAPSMQVSRARLRAASHAVDAAVADLMPSVSASVSLNWTDPLWYWRWGVNAAQTLFTGFGKTTALRRAVVAMDAAAAAVETQALELSLAIELAVAERDNAREALGTTAASVRSAKENYDTVSEQFSVGDASRVDFTDAAAAYVTALANHIKAFYRGQMAEAALFALLGRAPVYVTEEGEAK